MDETTINLGNGIDIRIKTYDPNGPTLLTVSAGDVAGSAVVNIVDGQLVLEPWHPYEHTA